MRELDFAYERYKQSWAKKLIACLCEINDLVRSHKEKGLEKLDAAILIKYDKRYSRILSTGRKEHLSLPVIKSEKTGKVKQHKVKNLWDRLRDYKEDTLRFMHNFDVPFTNNGSEGDIRMCKVKSKISGSFRSVEGASSFCKIRSYISTAKKHSINIMDALSDAFKAQPFLPTVTNHT